MSLFFTNVAYASESLDQFIINVNKLIINPLVTLIFVLAWAYFLWGVFQFLSNQTNEEKRTSGKKHMIWGVVGITIMMAVWTIMSLIINTFDIKGINPQSDTVGGTVNLPDYNPSSTNLLH